MKGNAERRVPKHGGPTIMADTALIYKEDFPLPNRLHGEEPDKRESQLCDMKAAIAERMRE